MTMKRFRVHAAPFACFDEQGKPADDRVQDYAQRCVDAALEVANAVDDFSPAEFETAVRLMQEWEKSLLYWYEVANGRVK